MAFGSASVCHVVHFTICEDLTDPTLFAGSRGRMGRGEFIGAVILLNTGNDGSIALLSLHAPPVIIMHMS